MTEDMETLLYEWPQYLWELSQLIQFGLYYFLKVFKIIKNNDSSQAFLCWSWLKQAY